MVTSKDTAVGDSNTNGSSDFGDSGGDGGGGGGVGGGPGGGGSGGGGGGGFFRDKNQLHTTDRPRQLQIHTVPRILRPCPY